MLYSRIYRKFLSLFMPLIIAINGISFTIPFITDSALGVEINYEFENQIPGSAEGTVTLETKIPGTYKLYWGDENYNKLLKVIDGKKTYYTEFTSVKVKDGEGESTLYDFTAIPDDAETVLAYNCNTLVGKMDIPDNKTPDDKPLYSFGALSDVHFNRYYLSLGDDALVTFPNALKFLEKAGASFVGMSGDLSNSGKRSAFEKFNSVTSQFDFNVFTCTGNHDVNNHDFQNDFDIDSWRELVNTGVYGDKKVPGILEVAPNNLDFTYSIPGGNGDVFIFLSQIAWSYGNPETSRLLEDSQLSWLSGQFEKYKSKNVFLFFHTFLADLDGVSGTAEGDILTSKGYSYDGSFTFGAKDEVQFRALLKKYKNVVFFNGHSHWNYSLQSINSKLNISNYDGEYCTMVHIPSVTGPRYTTDGYSKEIVQNLRNSFGDIVTVYPNRIVFTACDFLKGQFISNATYMIESKD